VGFEDRKAMDVRTPGTGSRVDHLLIADMVEPGARVLDIGCDTGDLLKLPASLERHRFDRFEIPKKL